MCYYDGDGESRQCYQETTPRARKAHRCGECHRVIAAGEIYHLATGIWGGNWGKCKICGHCWVGVQWLQAECGGYLFAQVEEDLAEHLREAIGSVRLAKLVVGMRRQWRQFATPEIMPIPQIPRVSALREVNSGR